jgi:hypothetical protein
LRSSLNYTDWTIDRWRLERPLKGIQLPVEETNEGSPPLWKDVALASAVAVILWWGVVAVALG